MRIPKLVLICLLLVPVCRVAPGAAADAVPAFRKAVALSDRKNYAAARAVLQKLIRARPKEGLYWFNLGGAQYNLGDYRAAQSAFETVVRLRSPLSPAALLCLAKCHRKQ